MAIRFRHAIPPGPDNPLGDYAMRLAIPGGAYLIHGTNKPVGVGMQVTHGCIRMYPEDIESLFRMVNVGTKVRIINEAVKTGWDNGVLYLEVHPPLENSGAAPVDLTQLTRVLVAATRNRPVRINWPLAERTLNESRGKPVAISLPVGLEARATANRNSCQAAKKKRRGPKSSAAPDSDRCRLTSTSTS